MADLLSFDMILEAPWQLKTRWNELTDQEKRAVPMHLGHLPSLMNLHGHRTMIEAFTAYWDNDRMVFRFATTELPPTIEEIQDLMDYVLSFCYRKLHPEAHILISKKPSVDQIVEYLDLYKPACTWTSKSYIRLNDLYNISRSFSG